MSAGAAPPDTAPATASAMLVAETIGSVCWLAMDAGWMLGWRVLATALVAPCLMAHALLFRYGPRTRVALAVTASMNCWLAMNALWMLADVWAMPRLLLLAKAVCLLATLLLVLGFSRSRGCPEAPAPVRGLPAAAAGVPGAAPPLDACRAARHRGGQSGGSRSPAGVKSAPTTRSAGPFRIRGAKRPARQ